MTYDSPSETLAYIDHDSEGFLLVLFTLGQYTRRTHRRKTLAAAQRMLDKHLASEMYNQVRIEI
jgi:hypothetical protein